MQIPIIIPVERDSNARDMTPSEMHMVGWLLLAWIITCGIAIWLMENWHDVPGWVVALLLGWPLLALVIGLVMA